MRSLLVFIVLATCFGCQKPEQVKVDIAPVRINSDAQRIKRLEDEVARMKLNQQRESGTAPTAPIQSPSPADANRGNESSVDREDRQELESVVSEYNASIEQNEKLSRRLVAKYKNLPNVNGSDGQVLGDSQREPSTKAADLRLPEMQQDLAEFRKSEGHLREMRNWIKAHRFAYLYRYERGDGNAEFFRIIPREARNNSRNQPKNPDLWPAITGGASGRQGIPRSSQYSGGLGLSTHPVAVIQDGSCIPRKTFPQT